MRKYTKMVVGRKSSPTAKLKHIKKEDFKMPNWCENELIVSGNREELERFKKKAKGKNGCLDMNSFIPYPEEFEKQDLIAKEHNEKIRVAIQNMADEEKIAYIEAHSWMKDGYNSGGHEWCYENWGTKWNFSDTELIDEDDGTLYYFFDTAWAPPEPVIKQMAKVFPELDFELRYFEGSNQFNGILVLEEGQVTVEKCAEYFGHRGG